MRRLQKVERNFPNVWLNIGSPYLILVRCYLILCSHRRMFWDDRWIALYVRCAIISSHCVHCDVFLTVNQFCNIIKKQFIIRNGEGANYSIVNTGAAAGTPNLHNLHTNYNREINKQLLSTVPQRFRWKKFKI